MQFLNALVKKTDPERTHHLKRCIGVTQSETSRYLTIHFEDGSTYEADVVLGADGIRSSVRSAVTGDQTQNAVVYSNTNCYRGLVPMEKLASAGLVTDLSGRLVGFLGKDKVILQQALVSNTCR